MKEDFSVHNLFWQDVEEFKRRDPHLARLSGLPFIHSSILESEIPVFIPGIYILTGGRQVGKSTLMKLIIRKLLTKEDFLPSQIYYLPCDTVVDFKQLLFEIEQFRASIDPKKYFVLFLDEISYVKEWDRAIKSLADGGFFNNGSVVITGSDMSILKEAMMKFPGRRGNADRQDFHLYPLSFYEYVLLKDSKLCSGFTGLRADSFEKLKNISINLGPSVINKLYTYFNEYILTGGFMPAINDYAGKGTISPAIYQTYTQWVVGDVIKKNKQEYYLREIISSLIPRLTKQVTWHNISSSTSIEHHQTVAEYLNLLVNMDVLNIFYALREDKLQPAPKKAKKINFNDPFIFHTLHSWVKNEMDSFGLANSVVNLPSDLKNALIEGTIASLLSRNWRTYYIKAECEVDIAIVKDNNFLPIEIKNSISFDKKDIRQIFKYKKGLIGYAGFQITKYEHLDVIPIPLLALAI